METDMMLFAGNSHLQFARDVARHLGLPLYEPCLADAHGPQIKWFSNGNCLVDVKVHVRNKDCFVIQTQSREHALVGKDASGADKFGIELSVSDMIMELIMLVDALKSSRAARITVVMPYMPYIRSDKLDHPRVSIGARVMATLLQAAGADGMLIMDPHFAQIHGFFPNTFKVDVLKAKPIFARYFLGDPELSDYALVAPDVNESKHSGPMASLLGLLMAIIDKRREDDSEKAIPVALIGAENVRGKKAIMFDDELASGGTVIEGAEFVAGYGVKGVIPAPTHPILSSMDGVRRLAESPQIVKLVTTDTVPINAEKRRLLGQKLHVISVAPNFAEAIRIIHADEDLEVYKKSLYDGLKELRK